VWDSFSRKETLCPWWWPLRVVLKSKLWGPGLLRDRLVPEFLKENFVQDTALWVILGSVVNFDDIISRFDSTRAYIHSVISRITGFFKIVFPPLIFA